MSDEYIKTNDIVNAINVLLDNVDASEDAMHKFCDSMNDIQKVEIVRCKDCIHNHITSWNQGKRDDPSCHFTDYRRSNEFYCGFGERADT